MADWLPITQNLPLDGEVVDTKIDDAQGSRNEQPLKRQGNLWFVEDGSMYVYYRPTHWRPTDPQARAERLRSRLATMDKDRAAVEAELRTLGVMASQTEQRQVREDSQGLGEPGRLSPVPPHLQRAQAEVAAWPPERLRDLRLQGSTDGVAMGDCGNAECNWRGPISECSYIGTVGPCCPQCREIVEPDAPGVGGPEHG